MDIIKSKYEIIKMAIISIIFASIFLLFNHSVYATEVSEMTQEQYDAMRQEITEWLNFSCNKPTIESYVYDDGGVEKTMYAFVMPQPSGKIGYKAATGKYFYNIVDSRGYIVGQCFFDVYTLMLENGTFNGVTIDENNYSTYIQGQEQEIVQTKTAKLLRVVSKSYYSDVKFYVNLINGVIVGDDISPYHKGPTTLDEQEKTIKDMLKETFKQIGEYLKGKILPLFCDLVLRIADGIYNIITFIFGNKVTIRMVIFNDIDKLSINFWSRGYFDSPTAILKPVVDKLYGILNGIVIVVYLIMLLYIGIRILLASTAKSGRKYKDMLMAWLTGIMILAFYPYVMKYTVKINNAFVEMIGSSESDENDAMQEVRILAEDGSNIPLAIIYIIMLGQLIVLLATYYKRMFTLSFLITIFPIVAGLYVWEKVKGGAKALGTWTREYVILVMVQTFHAVVYSVLINGALGAFSNTGNWFIFFVCVMFLFKAEKIIRTIFGQKSSANTIGDLASSGAAAWATAKGVKGMFARDKTKDDKVYKENAKRAADASKKIAEAEKKNAVDEAIKEQEKSESTSKDTEPQNAQNQEVTENAEENQMNNLGTAKTFAEKLALDKKLNPGLVLRGVKGAVKVNARAAGIMFGLATGLAQGDMKAGVSNAVIANEIAGMGAKLINGITGYTFGRFSGMVLKAKIKSGAMDEELRKLGFDLDGKFDEDEQISKAKAKIFRDALAAKAEAERRGGKVDGDLAFMREIERGRKREHL